MGMLIILQSLVLVSKVAQFKSYAVGLEVITIVATFVIIKVVINFFGQGKLTFGQPKSEFNSSSGQVE